MSDLISIVLNVRPTGKGRPRSTKTGRMYTPAQTVNAEAEIRWLLSKKKFPILEGPLFMSIKAHFIKPKSCPRDRTMPSVKPDLDNVVKLVKDACNKILFQDDAQICFLVAQKVYGDTECIHLTVGRLDDYSVVS